MRYVLVTDCFIYSFIHSFNENNSKVELWNNNYICMRYVLASDLFIYLFAQ